jgi:hypothetical protein
MYLIGDSGMRPGADVSRKSDKHGDIAQRINPHRDVPFHLHLLLTATTLREHTDHLRFVLYTAVAERRGEITDIKVISRIRWKRIL